MKNKDLRKIQVDNNETTNPENNETDGTAPHGELGQLLKDYREGANLDFDQAADKLCLTPSTLKALEAEDFDSLPEAPYVRGYLRGYAKLANVSSAEAIALYEQVRSGVSPSDFQYNFSPNNTVNDIIKPAVPTYMIKLGIALVAVLLVAVLAMIPGVQEWTSGIWSEFSQKNVVAKQDTVPEESTADKADVDKPASQSASTEVASAATTKAESEKANTTGDVKKSGDAKKAEGTDTASSNSATDKNAAKTATKAEADKASDMSGIIKRDGETAESNASATEQTADSTEKATDTKTADAASASTDEAKKKPDAENADAAAQTNVTTAENAESGTDAEKTAEGTDLTTAATTANTEEDNKTEVEKATEAAAATTDVDLSNVDTASGEAVVKLVFKDEVWMRVNSGNKKVFSGLKKSGDAEEFKASKPLSFKVGNAPGVDIYINGKLYDQSPHVRGVVSKFKVQGTP